MLLPRRVWTVNCMFPGGCTYALETGICARCAAICTGGLVEVEPGPPSANPNSSLRQQPEPLQPGFIPAAAWSLLLAIGLVLAVLAAVLRRGIGEGSWSSAWMVQAPPRRRCVAVDGLAGHRLPRARPTKPKTCGYSSGRLWSKSSAYFAGGGLRSELHRGPGGLCAAGLAQAT